MLLAQSTYIIDTYQTESFQYKSYKRSSFLSLH